MTTVRLCAYNVHGFRSGVDVVAEAIAEERPDLLFVNEVGRAWRLRRFARRLGMEPVSGMRLFRKNPNAVLFRAPWRLLEKRIHHLRRHTRLLPRGVVLARLGHAGARLWAGSVHLGLSDGERELHAVELTDLLAGLRPPVVLGGDLNEDPGRRAATWIAGRLWDSFAHAGEGAGETFPCLDPSARIDYLFLSEGITPLKAWVGSGDRVLAASDHRPVFADVELATLA
ncbi:MAG TPA: endonuclease/exonuclease/phosphatase family protein [Actinomycetota bacterium]|nr:endonuclease/exonuclease/phosphatase family protein [Actinomycetota bacterium]